MIYLTGDTHGQFDRVYDFCKRVQTRQDDVLVILGDVGFNYYLNSRDSEKKAVANQHPVTWFCIKGNHEKYAGTLPNYVEQQAFNGTVYVEPEYPNLLFAKDGEIYTFNMGGESKNVLVIGGAYSIDKHYRLMRGLNWFEDEQPSEQLKKHIEDKIKNTSVKIDYVFSHTCPKRYEPIEWFLEGIEQEYVDKSTEEWLDTIYDQLPSAYWYCGHYHGNKVIDNIQFLYKDYVVLGEL